MSKFLYLLRHCMFSCMWLYISYLVAYCSPVQEIIKKKYYYVRVFNEQTQKTEKQYTLNRVESIRNSIAIDYSTFKVKTYKYQYYWLGRDPYLMRFSSDSTNYTVNILTYKE